ncbi:MAG: DUF3459 domain-containing protein [Chloroflexi bacterium]|nr:DUF3459 domain-containing protein [Chloroflexota bacterium]
MTRWWRDAVFYQVYPRSFADSDGDGVGDLPGIIAHLASLAETGFDAIWLSPFYRSPMADFGYDISDHSDVDPVFGTVADLDALLVEAHRLGLRVIIDLVPNHTSAEHPWFRSSRASRQSPHRDWYVWRDGSPDGGPPNDWQSQFPRVGPGWTFDPPTGQWYLHSYLPDQPDLDWDHPEVVEAMSEVMRGWLRRGVDGFRIDVPQRLAKDRLFRDNEGLAQEPDPRFVGRRYDEDQDHVVDRLRAIRAVTDEFPDRVLVGEVYVLDQRRMARYVAGGDRLHLAHDFTFLRVPWDVAAIRAAIEGALEALGPDGWPTWCLGNHDHGRIATRFGTDGRGEARARLIQMLLLTLRGTPFIYQGDELGLPDSVVPPDRVVDIHDRDRVRGPMAWAPPSVAGAGAGFTTGYPWLPLTDQAERLNVETQLADPASMLSLVRQLLRLRRSTPALRQGDLRLLDGPPGVLIYRRALDGDRLTVVLNLGIDDIIVSTPWVPPCGRILLGTTPGREGESVDGALRLSACEGAVVRTDDDR